MTQTRITSSPRAGVASSVITETSTKAYVTTVGVIKETEASSTVLGAHYSVVLASVSASGTVGSISLGIDSNITLSGVSAGTVVEFITGVFRGVQGRGVGGALPLPYNMAFVASANQNVSINRGHGAGMPATITQMTYSSWLVLGFDYQLATPFSVFEPNLDGYPTFDVQVASDVDGTVCYVYLFNRTPSFFFVTSTLIFEGIYHVSVPYTIAVCHIVLSFDRVAQVVQFYFDDQPISNSGQGWQPTAALIDNSDVNNAGNSIWTISQNVRGFGTAGIGDLWINPSFLDLSVTANRRKFISDTGAPVDLGANGETPIGTSPIIFLHVAPDYGVPSDLVTNNGTGGSWTSVNPLSFSEAVKPTVTAVAETISLDQGITLDGTLPAAQTEFYLVSSPVWYEVLRPPTYGELSIEPDGSFTYAPRADFYNDEDTFTYNASIPLTWPYSPGIETSTATMTLLVNRPNPSPLKGVYFDGFTYLFNSVSPTVIGDHPQGTLSFWFRSPYINNDFNTFAEIFFGSDTLNAEGVPLFNTTTRQYTAFMWVSDGSSDPLFLSMSDGQPSTTNAFAQSGLQFWLSDGYWHHVMCSWNTDFAAGSRQFHWAVDGYVARTIRQSGGFPDIGNAFAPNWAALAGFVIGNGGSVNNLVNSYKFHLAEFYLNIDAQLDLTDPANIAKFVTGLAPADLGSDGSLPTGTPPLIYLTIPDDVIDPAAFAINRGIGMVDFTVGGNTIQGDITGAGTLSFSDRNPYTERPIKYPTGTTVDITVRTAPVVLPANAQVGNLLPGPGPATLLADYPSFDGDGMTLVDGSFVEIPDGQHYVVRSLPSRTSPAVPPIWQSGWNQLQALDFFLDRSARAISRDGTTAVGYSVNASTIRRAVRWTTNPGFFGGLVTDLQPDGFGGDAMAVSADGQSIVGIVYSSGGDSLPFLWTAIDGVTVLPDLLGSPGHPTPQGISDDGTIIVGYSLDATSMTVACRYDTNGWTSLGTLPGGTESHAYAISPDGSTIVGSSTGADGLMHAVRWTIDGIVDLGNLPGYANAEAHAISGNGIIIGKSTIVDSARGTELDHAIRWANGEILDLGFLTGGSYARALGITSDGTIIVGTADDLTYVPFDSRYAIARRAFLWREESGMIGLDTSPGIFPSSEANAISGDGAVIAGERNTGQLSVVAVAALYGILPSDPFYDTDLPRSDYVRREDEIDIATYPVFPTLTRLAASSTRTSIYRPYWLDDPATGQPNGYIVTPGSSLVKDGQTHGLFLVEQATRSGKGIVLDDTSYRAVKLWGGFDFFDRSWEYTIVTLFPDTMNNLNYLIASSDMSTGGWNGLPFLSVTADAITGLDVSRNPVRINDPVLDAFLIGSNEFVDSVTMCEQGLVIIAFEQVGLTNELRLLVISPDCNSYTYYRVAADPTDDLAIDALQVASATPTATIDSNGILWLSYDIVLQFTPDPSLVVPYTTIGSATHNYLPTTLSGRPMPSDYYVAFICQLDTFGLVEPQDGTSMFVIGRADDSNLGYRCEIAMISGHFHLQLHVGTTLSQDIDMGASLFQQSPWVTISLMMEGANVTVSVQDANGTEWMDPTGTFQSTQINAIEIIDTTYSAVGKIVYGSVGE